jgi:branched-chain amino acid transport system ATP-binding protein
MTHILDVRSLTAGYGEVMAVRSVTMHADRGEVVSIVGANGAGKTTLLSALSGIVTPMSGEVFWDGTDITTMPAYARPYSGVALVPEGGRLFPFMTVRENLELGAYSRDASEIDVRMEELFEIFPILKERQDQMAGQLSGGERQMCAIARAMMSRPRLLMLDEPSVGLSPVLCERVFETIRTLVAKEDLTVVLVEQNVFEALEISDRGYIIDHGEIVKEGIAAELRDDPQVGATYMGL